VDVEGVDAGGKGRAVGRRDHEDAPGDQRPGALSSEAIGVREVLEHLKRHDRIHRRSRDGEAGDVAANEPG
jgi:hypothetical protein